MRSEPKCRLCGHADIRELDAGYMCKDHAACAGRRTTGASHICGASHPNRRASDEVRCTLAPGHDGDHELWSNGTLSVLLTSWRDAPEGPNVRRDHMGIRVKGLGSTEYILDARESHALLRGLALALEAKTVEDENGEQRHVVLMCTGDYETWKRGIVDQLRGVQPVDCQQCWDVKQSRLSVCPVHGPR